MSSSASYKHKSRHRSRSRSPNRPRDRDNLDNQQDLNIRVKEEPISEDEGRRNRKSNHDNSSRSGRRSHVIHEFEAEGSHRSYYENRSYNRPRERGHGGRTRERESDSRDRGDRGNFRSASRNQNRNERPFVKTEPRSRSRSPAHEDNGRNHHNHSNSNTNRRSGRSRFDDREETDRQGPNQSNPVRERDWANFFDPSSEMSRTAAVKREKEEADRKVALQGGEEDNSKKEKEKEKPNFGLSGKLTEDTNSFRGVVIKYSEPPEARKPLKIRWRLYPFKDQEALPTMYIHRQSAYLLGRERKIADIPIDHPSCSKQHAVIQFRLMPYVRPDGSKGRRIKPYVLDLESSNGTYVNGDRIEPKRYVELFEKDVLKFGYSSREYVLLHEHSKDEPDDDTPGSSPEAKD